MLCTGSCTACVVALHREESAIYTANLGDSGFRVVCCVQEVAQHVWWHFIVKKVPSTQQILVIVDFVLYVPAKLYIGRRNSSTTSTLLSSWPLPRPTCKALFLVTGQWCATTAITKHAFLPSRWSLLWAAVTKCWQRWNVTLRHMCDGVGNLFTSVTVWPLKQGQCVTSNSKCVFVDALVAQFSHLLFYLVLTDIIPSRESKPTEFLSNPGLQFDVYQSWHPGGWRVESRGVSDEAVTIREQTKPSAHYWTPFIVLYCNRVVG